MLGFFFASIRITSKNWYFSKKIIMNTLIVYVWDPPVATTIQIQDISTIRLLELPRALRHTATNQKLGEDAFNIIIAIYLCRYSTRTKELSTTQCDISRSTVDSSMIHILYRLTADNVVKRKWRCCVKSLFRRWTRHKIERVRHTKVVVKLLRRRKLFSVPRWGYIIL